MFWIILISFLLALLAWILFTPVILHMGTEKNRYYLALPGLFKASVVPGEDLFMVRGWILFIPYRFDPFKERKQKAGKKNSKSKKTLSLPSGIKNRHMLGDIKRAIRIRKLELDLDTDDFVLNAWLIPVFSGINSGNIRMRVNFEGRASLLLDIRTRLGSLFWILIKNKSISWKLK